MPGTSHRRSYPPVRRPVTEFHCIGSCRCKRWESGMNAHQMRPVSESLPTFLLATVRGRGRSPRATWKSPRAPQCPPRPSALWLIWVALKTWCLAFKKAATAIRATKCDSSANGQSDLLPPAAYRICCIIVGLPLPLTTSNPTNHHCGKHGLRTWTEVPKKLEDYAHGIHEYSPGLSVPVPQVQTLGQHIPYYIDIYLAA